MRLTDEARESLLRAWPWPAEAATTEGGFPAVVSAVECIIDQSYEVGYRDGENSGHADWFIALDDLMPDGVEVTPVNVASLLRRSTSRPSP